MATLSLVRGGNSVSTSTIQETGTGGQGSIRPGFHPSMPSAVIILINLMRCQELSLESVHLDIDCFDWLLSVGGLVTCIAKLHFPCNYFISGLIRLFLFVGEVIASRTNSTTSLMLSQFSLYLFINSLSSIVSKTFLLAAAIFRFFVNRSY